MSELSKCQHVESVLLPFADQMLDQAEAQRIAAHLAGCASCSAALAAWEHLDHVLREAPQPVAEPAVRQRLMARIASAQARHRPQVQLDGRVAQVFGPDAPKPSVRVAPIRPHHILRLANLVAAALLVIFIGSLVAGLILVRNNETAKNSSPRLSGATATTPGAPAGAYAYVLDNPAFAPSALVKVNLQTGAVVWTYQQFTGDPVIANGSVYGCACGKTAYNVFALNAATGTQRWKHQIPKSDYQVPGSDYNIALLPGGAILYVVTAEQNNLVIHALNAADGSERWSAVAIQNVYAWTVTLAQGVIYGTYEDTSHEASGPTGYNSGVLFAINANDGKLLWQTAIKNEMLQVVVGADGTLYVSSSIIQYPTAMNSGAPFHAAVEGDAPESCCDSSRGYVYAYSRDGKQLWRSQQFQAASLTPVAADGVVYVALLDHQGDVYALHASDGSLLWHAQVSGEVAILPILADGNLYIVSVDSQTHLPLFLTAVNASSGSLRWKQSLDQPLYHSSDGFSNDWCALVNGKLYLPAAQPKGLVMFSPSDGSLLGQVSLNFVPADIVVAP